MAVRRKGRQKWFLPPLQFDWRCMIWDWMLTVAEVASFHPSDS